MEQQKAEIQLDIIILRSWDRNPFAMQALITHLFMTEFQYD